MHKALKKLLVQESLFTQIVEDYGIPKGVVRKPGFASLVLIILEQQVSLESAKATFDRLSRGMEVEAGSIATSSTDQLRSYGITRQKANYIFGLAGLIQTGAFDIDGLADLPIDQIYQSLLSVRGIGPWTAQIYLMFCLGAPDIFPSGDIALYHSMKELFGVERNDAITFAERWSPYRSTAAFLLWDYYLNKRNRKIP